MKFSKNKAFAVIPKDEEFLYIHKSIFKQAQSQNPFIFKYLSQVRQSGRKAVLPDYIKLNNTVNFKKFDNDCLMLAEAIISQDLEKPDYTKAKLRIKEPDGKNRLFGHTDAQNVKIAKDIRASSSIQDL